MAAAHRHVVVYANSGESWDSDARAWLATTTTSDEAFAEMAVRWRECGASIIGGCCRTTPMTVRAIVKALRNESDS